MGRASTLGPDSEPPLHSQGADPGEGRLHPSDRTGDVALVPGDSLRVTDTVGTALARMGGSFGTIIVVVDDTDRLCGVVSAGNLRKAILTGHGLATPLSQVMNTQPVTIHESKVLSRSGIQDVLEGLRKHYAAAPMMYAMVPVVDDTRRVSGLIDLRSLARIRDLGFRVRSRSALLIGGAGYIGSMLTRKLVEDGWSVTILDTFLYGEDSLAGLDTDQVRIIRGDVRNIDNMVEAASDVDAAVYLAELVGDPAVSTAPQTALKTNYLAATALAHLCAYLNINRFVYLSSCSVYGASQKPDSFLTEESPTAPVSLYGTMKLLVEETVLSTARQPNRLFAPTILRLGTVFGLSARPRFDLVVNTLVKEACKHGRIRLFGGEQWRPQIHVRDVARAIVRVIEAPLDRVRGQTFNVGSTEQNHTVADLGEFARQVFPQLEVICDRQATDPRSYRVDCDKIRDALGFRTEISVIDGMKELKTAIELGKIRNPDASQHNNYQTVRELAFD